MTSVIKPKQNGIKTLSFHRWLLLGSLLIQSCFQLNKQDCKEIYAVCKDKARELKGSESRELKKDCSREYKICKGGVRFQNGIKKETKDFLKNIE